MGALKEIQELHKEYLSIKEQILTSQKTAKEIISAVTERLERERKQHNLRIAELEAKCNDLECSETFRRIAKIELEKCLTNSISVCAEEIKAFEIEMSVADVALKDISEIREKIRSAINEANAKIFEMRNDTLGDKQADLYERWIAGCRSEFERLCKGGKENE